MKENLIYDFKQQYNAQWSQIPESKWIKITED